MKIKITDFAERHFDKDFSGTKILDFSVEEFEKKIDNDYSHLIRNGMNGNDYTDDVIIHNGYADFCKLVAIPNFTKAKVGSMPITLENYHYLRSGYSARREGELPVFSRWLELPLGKPVAEWLILVLYDKNQIDKEAKEGNTEKSNFVSFPADWGIVAILGQSHSDEEPMKPETMIRNGGYNTIEYQEIVYDKINSMVSDALEYCTNKKEINNNDEEEDTDDSCTLNEYKKEVNIDEDIKELLSTSGKNIGGSGEPFSKEQYIASVNFWDKNATVK